MISNEAREAASMLLNWLEWGVPGEMRVFEKAFQSVIDAERERCAGIVNERDALMQALVAAHEDNLWNEYHTGSVRDGRWTHMFMSDGECLALDCGFDPKNADYPDDAIRAAIPAAAGRRAQDALFAIRGSTNEF